MIIRTWRPGAISIFTLMWVSIFIFYKYTLIEACANTLSVHLYPKSLVPYPRLLTNRPPYPQTTPPPPPHCWQRALEGWPWEPKWKGRGILEKATTSSSSGKLVLRDWVCVQIIISCNSYRHTHSQNREMNKEQNESFTYRIKKN